MTNMPYLKCKYYQGVFSHEYFILFNCSHQNWCFVNKEDVKPINGVNGLVKVVLRSIEEDSAVIGINDTGDMRQTSFMVPKEEVIEKY